MPCVAEVVNRSLKADCTDFTQDDARDHGTHFNLKLDFRLIEIEICFRNEI